MNFAIGASGINSSISGTGTATYNGDFISILRAASTLATIGPLQPGQTFGETFTVAGFDDAGSVFGSDVHGVLYRFSKTQEVEGHGDLLFRQRAAEDHQIWTSR
jgi:hypothetical protein